MIILNYTKKDKKICTMISLNFNQFCLYIKRKLYKNPKKSKFIIIK